MDEPITLAGLDEPMLQFFAWRHLPEHLQRASEPFAHLAAQLVNDYPRNPERTVALRKLLEAKDAAVRSLIYRTPGTDQANDAARAETQADYQRDFAGRGRKLPPKDA